MSNLVQLYEYLEDNQEGVHYLPDICSLYAAKMKHTNIIDVLPCIVITVEDGYDNIYLVRNINDLVFDQHDVRTVIFDG